jgi:hypothetical protein
VNIRENLTQCSHRPITTKYDLKTGFRYEDHAIIYTSDDLPPLQKAEQISEKFASIRIIPQSHRDRLHKSSRVNYTKIYTIGYNIKMQVIGQIDEDHKEKFLNNVRLAHPSLSSTTTGSKGEFLGEIYSKFY